MQKSSQKATRKVAYILIIFATLLILSFISLENIFLGNQANKVSLQNAVSKTKERELFIKNFLNQAKDILSAVRESGTFNDFLNAKQSKIDDLFMMLAKSNPSVMQFRFIDKHGLEKIKIDRIKQGSEPFVVSQIDLQNKSDRDYFIEAKKSPFEKVFFTAIDLNIEHNQLEKPYKPIIRAVIPISKNGKFYGILIVNYFMEDFLHRLLDAPLYDMILADQQGNTLIHYESSKNWGAYQQNRYKIDKDFPKEYKEILSNNLVEKENFVSRRLDLPIKNGLIMIVQLKKSYLENSLQAKSHLYLIVILLVFFLATVASIFLSSTIAKMYHELNKKLDNSQKKFFTLFQESLDPIVIVELPTQKFVEFNQKALDFYRYTKEEFSNLCVHDLDIVYSEERTKEFQESIIQKGWEKFITQHRTKDGVIKDVLINVVLIYLENKTYLYATIHDITAEKEHEESLKKLISEQEALMQIKTTGFVHLKDRHFIWMNEKFEEMLGYAKGELKDQNSRIMYINDEEYQKYGEGYKELVEHGVYTGEIKGIKKDGTQLTLLASLTALNQNNEVLGVLIDITKEKEQQRVIEEQKEELEAIFNTSKDGIAILDLETNFLDVNDAYLEMTGFSKEEILTKSCFGLTAPEDYENTLKVAEQLKEKGYVRSFNKTCIVKNGKRIFVNMSVSLMPDNQRIVLTAKDITDMKKYEKKLEYTAHYDALTGLPNRTLKSDRLAQAISRIQRNGGCLAVLFIDLDGFKWVNDTYGHDVGDYVLVEASVRMKRALRGGDTLARLGGDEFLAIVADMGDASIAIPIVERILKVVNDPIIMQDIKRF